MIFIKKQQILNPANKDLSIKQSMKHFSPDISWHGQKQRILSIDFHPFTNEFVTAGSQQRLFIEEKQSDNLDGCVKIWEINHNNLNQPLCKYGISELNSNVNVAKYSPDGRFLAVATDFKQIIIYVERQIAKNFFSQEKSVRWGSYCKFFGHGQDVVDLAWTKDSQHIVSASMDGTVKFWTLNSKSRDSKSVASFQKAVQGVAVHPNVQYIIAVGNDQVVKLIGPTTGNKKSRLYDNWYVKKTFEKYNHKKGVIEKEEVEREEEEKIQTFKMFANESVASFFRRPAVSPDGELFILPCGIWRQSPGDDPKCCAYLFRKNYITMPSFSVLTNKEPVLVCKFCPVLFKKTNPEEGLFKQPYYMVFAIATTNSVLIFNTESLKPLYGMGNIHFAAHTDLSWKEDQILAISSSDGFISFFLFSNNQLGLVYEPDQGPLKDMISRKKWVPQIKTTQSSQQIPQQVQQQQTIRIQTADGVKKKIIPKIISKGQ